MGNDKDRNNHNSDNNQSKNAKNMEFADELLELERKMKENKNKRR